MDDKSYWQALKGKHLDEVTSSNQYLKEHHQGVGDWLQVNTQSAGRGRGDHLWHSPKGNLYLSVCLPRREPLTLVSLAVGVALYEFIHSFSLEVSLKWPNDILFEGKKCGGILSEVLDDVVIVGIGLNLSPDNLFEGSSYLPSLDLHSKNFVTDLLKKLATMTSNHVPSSFIQKRWIQCRHQREGEFCYLEEKFQGVIEEIDLENDNVLIKSGKKFKRIKASLLSEML